MSSLSASRIVYEFNICLAISIWIHYLFRKFTLNRPFCGTTMNSLWNQYENIIFFETSLGIYDLFREFTICFPNLQCIHYLFCDYSLNSSFSRIHCLFRKFTLNPLFSGKLLWIDYLLRDYSPSIHYLFCGTTMNSLWNHFETIMKSLWIHYLFRHFSLNWLSFSRIHYLFREFTLNPLSFFLNYYEFTIAFTLSLWKHYKKYPLFRHEFCDFAIFYVEK